VTLWETPADTPPEDGVDGVPQRPSSVVAPLDPKDYDFDPLLLM
jgi:hypothetical protein